VVGGGGGGGGGLGVGGGGGGGDFFKKEGTWNTLFVKPPRGREGTIKNPASQKLYGGNGLVNLLGGKKTFWPG